MTFEEMEKSMTALRDLRLRIATNLDLLEEKMNRRQARRDHDFANLDRLTEDAQALRVAVKILGETVDRYLRNKGGDGQGVGD